jgi:hypothetical protein
MSLNRLIQESKSNVGLGLEKDLRGAVSAAAELSAHLHKATNAKTGTLDFSRLN